MYRSGKFTVFAPFFWKNSNLLGFYKVATEIVLQLGCTTKAGEEEDDVELQGKLLKEKLG